MSKTLTINLLAAANFTGAVVTAEDHKNGKYEPSSASIKVGDPVPISSQAAKNVILVPTGAKEPEVTWTVKLTGPTANGEVTVAVTSGDVQNAVVTSTGNVTANLPSVGHNTLDVNYAPV